MQATRSASGKGRYATVVVAMIGAAVMLAPSVSTAQQPSPERVAAAALAPGSAPALKVTPIVSGLNIPWDLFFTPDGTMVYNQRGGGLWARSANGTVTVVKADFSDLLVEAEIGLMGMTADPDYASNRTFYTCQGHKDAADTVRQIWVIRWVMNSTYTGATRQKVLVSEIPQTAINHAGCRLKFDNDKLLYISTGDSGQGLGPQDLGSLNGKVLRVDREGQAPASNPYFGSSNSNTRLIFTRGHRNPQGLSLRPGTNEMWSVEQGTDLDDEINRLVPGGNYGWNPNKPPSPFYDQDTPMTNPNVPDAIPAVFATGAPTLAFSGGTWLSGTQWGRWNGTFLAAALKDTSVRVLSFAGQQSVVRVESPTELNTGYRLRTPLQGPDGALYLTTSNGNGTDQIWRVTPTAPGPGDGRCYGSATDPAAPTAIVDTGSTTTGYAIGNSGGLYARSIQAGAEFVSLGGNALYGPGAVSWDGVRTDVFVIGTNSELYHRFSPTGSSWSGWESLGGTLTSSPEAISFSSGTLNVFARGGDGALWTIGWTGSVWTGWRLVGGQLSGGPGAAVDRDTNTGRVGVRGLNGELYELSMTAGGRFSGFAETGVPICSSPAYSARTGDGESFGWVSSDASGNTSLVIGSAATQLGGRVLGSPAIAATGGSGYAMTGRGTDGSLWVFDARTGAGSWRSLGGQIR